MINLTAYLSVSAVLFALGLAGIILNRKNLIILLMCVELLLLAVNTNFVAFSHFFAKVEGQVFVFFILTIAAAETAVGLAILMVLFRSKGTIDVASFNSLKG